MLLLTIIFITALLGCCSVIFGKSNDLLSGGTKFANTTVWAAIIQTDPTLSGVMGRDFHKVPQGVVGTTTENALKRHGNARNMTQKLPFPVVPWMSVYAANCPFRNGKGNDRGVAMAHYQIWADFVYQGKFGVNKAIAKDQDILLVFEDDAVIAVRDIESSLSAELSSMSVDWLFLGWCYGRRGMPMW